MRKIIAAALLAGCAAEASRQPSFQELLPGYKIQCETQAGSRRYAVVEDSYGTPELVSHDGKKLKREICLLNGTADIPYFMFERSEDRIHEHRTEITLQCERASPVNVTGSGQDFALFTHYRISPTVIGGDYYKITLVFSGPVYVAGFFRGMPYDFDGDGDDEIFENWGTEWGILDWKRGSGSHRDDLADDFYQMALKIKDGNGAAAKTEYPRMYAFFETLCAGRNPEEVVAELTKYKLGQAAEERRKDPLAGTRAPGGGIYGNTVTIMLKDFPDADAEKQQKK